MPVIPGVQEQQRISPSNPVAIGASEQARLMGNASEKLGQAVFDLSVTLSRVAKADETAALKREARMAMDKVREAREKNTVELRLDNEPVTNPNLYDKKLKLSTYGEEQQALADMSEKARPYFQEYLTKYNADSTSENLVVGWELMGKTRDAIYASKQANFADTVVSMYNRNRNLPMAQRLAKLSDYQQEMSTQIFEDETLPLNKALELSQKMTQNGVAALVSDLTDRGDYNDARFVLKQFRNVFPEESKVNSMLEDIRRTQTTAISNAYTEIQRTRALHEMAMEDNRNTVAQQLSAQADMADTLEKQRRLQADVYTHTSIDPDFNKYGEQIMNRAQSGLRMTSEGLYSNLLVQMYEEEGRMTKPGGKTAVQKLTAMYANGKGSMDVNVYQEAMAKAAQLRQFTKNKSAAPQMNTIRQAAAAMKADGETYLANSYLDEKAKANKRQQTELSILKMYNEYMVNPQMSNEDVSKLVMRYKGRNSTDKNFGNRTGDIPQQQQINKDTSQNTMKKLAIDLEAAKRRGDKAKVRELSEKINKLGRIK